MQSAQSRLGFVLHKNRLDPSQMHKMVYKAVISLIMAKQCKGLTL